VKKFSFPLVVLVALIVGLVGAQVWKNGGLRGVAPTPAGFDHDGPGLSQAIDRARAEGRVVLALATADWCGPCQSFKRGALADERVTAWLEANAVTAYIDVDRRPDDAGALGVSAIPTTVLFRDGREVDRFTGPVSAGELLDRLAKAAG
jgi:thioredoxin-like negative regulator of GroEL